jgi:two-component system, cell cycle sensor histidine kinase and response regulator CckA
MGDASGPVAVDSDRRLLRLSRPGLGGPTLLGADVARLAPSIVGPVLTLASAIFLDILARHGLLAFDPIPVLLLAVVLSALQGGVGSGLVSGVLTVLYSVHYFSEPGALLHYSGQNARNVALIGFVAPAIGVIVGRLRQESSRLPQTPELSEADAMQRRLAYEADGVLSASLDYEATLQALARLCVPALADWCTIHLTDERGVMRCVAAAHGDAAHEILIRSLRHFTPRGFPDVVRTGSMVWADVADARLETLAEDEEHLRLLRSLEPRTLMAVPLVARGRVLGVLTLAGSRSRRRFNADDVALAEHLAGRAALAVDQIRLVRRLEEADQRYDLLFRSHPNPMWVFDTESLAFLDVNEAATRQYGYDRAEFLRMTIMDILPADDAPPLLPPQERAAARRDNLALTRHQKKDGTIVDVEIASQEMNRSQTRARLVLVTDITERARTKAALHESEEQLRQAQRMDAVGRLAGGVAHDFNNLLTAIQGYSDLLMRDMAPDHPHRHDLEEIHRAAERGALLTRQLLTFGRRQLLQPQVLDVNGVVTGMEGLVQRLVGADIQLVSVLGPDLRRVHVDRAQLEQVLVNLVLNARDAMPNGGTLTIETAERQIAASARSRMVRPGRYVVLAVSDSGTGMDEEAQSHLFEPFYSTKPTASGAGLGLSIVYGIVKQSRGVVRVTSEPGAGTTVKVYLPVATDDEESQARSTDDTAMLGRGFETVLVVEDEEGVRELLRKVLTRQGYTVIEARHGKDALLVVERHRGPIHLVITDVVMPEMGGNELVDMLQPSRPDLKVLYISGYTNDEIVRRGISNSGAAFLQKPFASDDLVRKVRELLDARTPVTAD